MSERTDLVTREESMPETKQELQAVAPLVDIYENEIKLKMPNKNVKIKNAISLISQFVI